MSRENIEVVRRGYEAFSGGDIERALAVLAAPDFECRHRGRSLNAA